MTFPFEAISASFVALLILIGIVYVLGTMGRVTCKQFLS
jgi:hypothetical protein